MSDERYQTKIEDINIGDIVVARWNGSFESLYVLQVRDKKHDSLSDGVGLFPASECDFFVLSKSYITIIHGHIVP